MTDRYYPKFCVPTVSEFETSYDFANKMVTNDRSAYPPGYAGHLHGVKDKYGYATAAADPVADAPIDIHAPDVAAQKGLFVPPEPMAATKINLATTPARETDWVEPVFDNQLFAKERDQTPVSGETEGHKTFTTQTSAFAKATKSNYNVKVDSKIPYMPAVNGCGTGYNSRANECTWFPRGPIEKSTLVRDSYTDPKSYENPPGLKLASYTQKYGLS